MVDELVTSESVPPTAVFDDAVARRHAWREWFEGWLHHPLERRSTGIDPLPPAYFRSAAAFIVSRLRLNPLTDDVLDVGCDSAMVSQHVAPRCRRFVGVDFIPALLRDSRRAGGPGATLAMAAADGRQLPFADASFDKVYCSAVIHTLPSLAEGLTLVDELIRVCRPGGEVLLASVPDVQKRAASQRLIWQRASIWSRVRILASTWLSPESRRRIRRAFGRSDFDPMRYLEYDLGALARTLGQRGFVAAVVDFPPTYWNVDFRTSRSSLHIVLPERCRGAV